MDLRLCLFQQALHKEWPNETGPAREQHVTRHWCVRHGRRHRRLEDKLTVVSHHLLLGGALLFAEGRKGMTQMNDCLFGSVLQHLGESKELGYADTLNDTDIYLPRQHLGALVFQELLELMHEHNKIQGIQAGFDEVVRFLTC